MTSAPAMGRHVVVGEIDIILTHIRRFAQGNSQVWGAGCTVRGGGGLHHIAGEGEKRGVGEGSQEGDPHIKLGDGIQQESSNLFPL